jgi:hypothetical protein
VSKEFTYFIDLTNCKFELADKNHVTWLHAMPIGKVQHPFYGEMDFSVEALGGYAKSVTGRTLGTVDPVIDYDHQMFSGLAAGWVKGARVVTDDPDGKNGLQLRVEFTDEAKKRIAAREYRYFSPTFTDEWEDQNGKTHKHVIFGGGLTNRPYLKNLVPVNLSELAFIQPPTPQPPTQEDEMDLAKLREGLGLAADTADDQVWKVFGERMQALATLNPSPTPPPPPTSEPPAPTFHMSEEIRALAAANPMVGNMIRAFENQVREAADMQSKLREQAITSKLNELDRSELIITPATKQLMHEVAEVLSDVQADKFWKLMDHFLTSQAFVVEMGERAGTATKYSRDKSAKQQFEELTNALVAGGMQYADAVSQVSAENPALYDRYRSETFIARV